MQKVRIRPRQRRDGCFKWFVLLCGLISMTFVIWFGWNRYVPNNTEEKPQFAVEHPVIVQGQVMKEGAITENGTVKLPLPVLQQASLGLKDSIHYEQKSGTIVLTNVDKVLRLKTNLLTATMNSKPYDLNVAAEVKADNVYIPVTPLEELYGLKVELNEATQIVTVIPAGEAVQRGKAGQAEVVIRHEASIRSPIAERILPGKEVRIWGEADGWYRVQSAQGYVGYAAKDKLQLANVEQIELPEREEPFVAWKVMGSKINMTWEAVYNKNPDISKIGPLTGVNVVSPTWFELIDGTGKISSKADKAYVDWAHKKGMQVWALFSNGFEPERTTSALADADKRFYMIQQLLAYAQMYKLQGINLDFENVVTSDKANLVQFVKELTPLLHEQGLVVSIDVTPKSNSEMWSKFLDRAALGEVVDYMIVMAYDEHWASSPKAGSVASLPWVEQALVKIMEEDKVPADKLVLAAPLYARLWTEKTDETGEVKVSSKALGMDAVARIVKERNLKPVFDAKTGQNYVEYTENGALQRIWIEDAVSMKARAALVMKYDLAGIATWQRTFQSDSIWAIIDDSLDKRP
ncbi:glycosyl hydrolase family 18 protein [Paenibacillus spongiae]|uniref:Glycosyl hydrolase family 18 protein n=1 Tax=Paenibacillus spongiae TaxID=2909671 RepID=A0ABY5SC40_9BACL|nr:glycosyl hydrolase family 18 protein [Paenibacillus spongiae]UVI31339.1 glycosyl hydrolase family 18 protein [Paenibacillus spongiae]